MNGGSECLLFFAMAAVVALVVWDKLEPARHDDKSGLSLDDDVLFVEAWEDEMDEMTREHLLNVEAELGDLNWKLSDADKERFDNHTGGRRSATFGYTTPSGVASLLRLWRQRNAGTRFLDLGSGLGHLVFFGAVLDATATFRGVEMSENRYELSRAALARLDLSTRISLERNDMFDVDVAQADAIFISSLTMNIETRLALGDKLATEATPGTVVISSLDLFSDDRLHNRSLAVAPMSWRHHHQVRIYTLGCCPSDKR